MNRYVVGSVPQGLEAARMSLQGVSRRNRVLCFGSFVVCGLCSNVMGQLVSTDVPFAPIVVRPIREPAAISSLFAHHHVNDSLLTVQKTSSTRRDGESPLAVSQVSVPVSFVGDSYEAASLRSLYKFDVANALAQQAPKSCMSLPQNDAVAASTLTPATAPASIATTTIKHKAAAECIADFNGDGVVEVQDFVEFVESWSSDSVSSDINRDGVIDFFDYLDFTERMNSGC